MIFAFLRPGIAPAFESEDLINIVESNFFSENTWSSISIPIAINKVANNTIKIEVAQEPPAKWDFVYYYSQQNLTALNIEVDNMPNKIKIGCISNAQCKTETSPFGAPFAGIYLVAMENTNATFKEFNFSVKCVPQVGPNACQYIVGAKEIFNGLKEANLLALASDPTLAYQQKKTDWKFPQTRDFSVSLEYLNGTAPIELMKPDYLLPEQLSIFVKEITMPILNQNASRTPAKISIKVW